jgi:hypothetical protein
MRISRREGVHATVSSIVDLTLVETLLVVAAHYLLKSGTQTLFGSSIHRIKLELSLAILHPDNSLSISH